jgi:Haem-containing dehydratase
MIPRTDLPQRRSAPPVHRPAGFQVAYDSFEPRFGPGKDHVMFAQFGIENRGGDASAVRGRLMTGFAGTNAPNIVEHGHVREGFGPKAEMWFAYWRSRDAYDRWLDRPDVAGLWNDDALLTGPIGLWREAGLISLDYNETSFSRAENISGLVHLSDGLAVTDIHGYWGSARDRIVAAADDPLDPPSERSSVASSPCHGKRVRITAPDNACFIRTSQDIASATKEQARVYADEVEPVFHAAMQFLRANGPETGCIGIRFVEECDAVGVFKGRTCGMGFFDSLGALERWTHNHPTHIAIMGSFMGMVQRFEGSPGLHLWHEVTVFPTQSLIGDYVNCSTDGGLAG